MNCYRFYILCKHLAESVSKGQPIEDNVRRIVEAVKQFKLDEEVIGND